MTLKEQYEALAEAILKHREIDIPCCLCKSMTRGRGIFFPDDPCEWGGLPGKQRALIYPLCEKHPQNDQTLEQIENWIRNQTDGINLNISTVDTN